MAAAQILCLLRLGQLISGVPLAVNTDRLHRPLLQTADPTPTAGLTLEFVCLGIQADDLSFHAGARDAVVANKDALTCETSEPSVCKPYFGRVW